MPYPEKRWNGFYATERISISTKEQLQNGAAETPVDQSPKGTDKLTIKPPNVDTAIYQVNATLYGECFFTFPTLC